MARSDIETIIIKYLNQKADQDELRTLDMWLGNEENSKLFERFVRTEYATTSLFEDEDLVRSKRSIWNKINEVKRKRLYRLRFGAVAAAAAIVLLISYPYLMQRSNNSDQDALPNTVTLAPGSNKAILTLEDGTEVVLEKGTSYERGSMSSNGEELYYKSGDDVAGEAMAYNYLTIPRRGQFFVELEDGTQVWLNSESKIKYPTAFQEGTDRLVELIYGEAYFDVSPSTNHNGAKFKVFHGVQEVEVLGTEFNVKAYQGEDMVYTTLVEGQVLVSNPNGSKVLSPNQQSVITKGDNDTIVVQNVDAVIETLWRKGIFNFRGKTLVEIGKVLSRWYDVEIVIQNKDLEEITFNGSLGKDQNLEQILYTIRESSAVNTYEMKGGKVYIN